MAPGKFLQHVLADSSGVYTQVGVRGYPKPQSQCAVWSVALLDCCLHMLKEP